MASMQSLTRMGFPIVAKESIILLTFNKYSYIRRDPFFTDFNSVLNCVTLVRVCEMKWILIFSQTSQVNLQPTTLVKIPSVMEARSHDMRS